MSTVARPLGYWVALVDRLVDERFAALLDEHGVTRGQFHLVTMLRKGPLPAQAVQQAAQSATARPDDLAELVDSGWVSETNGSFALTERGQAAGERLEQVVDSIVSTVDEAVDDRERAAMASGLEAAARSLGWTEAGGFPGADRIPSRG